MCAREDGSNEWMVISRRYALIAAFSQGSGMLDDLLLGRCIERAQDATRARRSSMTSSITRCRSCIRGCNYARGDAEAPLWHASHRSICDNFIMGRKQGAS
jgi:hypothetical protein